MAEERLIDDDKDRKYKIIKNADGEDELVIIDSDDGEEELPVYGMMTDEDDEEAAFLTPEQLAERERLRELEREQREKHYAALIQTTKEKLEEGDFESATYSILQAEELFTGIGEMYCLKLKALSRNMTSFVELEKCVEAAEGIEEYADGEQKQELLSLAGGLKQRIKEISEQVEQLKERNEQGKAERREVFAREKKKATVFFCCAAVPALILIVLAVVFSTMMFAEENGLFLILTIVFAALALISLFIVAFATNRLLTAGRKVRLNESNTATKVGREYDDAVNELEGLNTVYSSFANDIS